MNGASDRLSGRPPRGLRIVAVPARVSMCQWYMCRGVPARPIKERFSRKIAAELSQIAWWNWPPETIWERLPEFQSGDVEAFCARWRA